MKAILPMLLVALFLALCGVGMLGWAVYHPIAPGGPDYVLGGLVCLIAAMLSGMSAVAILTYEEVKHHEHETDEVQDV